MSDRETAAPETEPKEIQVPCPACGGYGRGGEVSREMAMDAGDPALEGMPIPCGHCNGDGWILEQVP